MKRQRFAGSIWVRLGVGAAVVAATTGLAQAQILFSENFDSLAGSLGPSVNERWGISTVTALATDAGSIPIPNAFTHTPPTGWSIDNNFNAYGVVPLVNNGVSQLGNPDYGVDEWEGWSIANKDFWVRVAGDQNRSQFTKGIGNVAIADSDEWDDLQVNPNYRAGFMSTNLITNDINVAAYQNQTLKLTFDSAWRAEGKDDPYGNPPIPSANCDDTSSCLNNQSVVIAVSFNGGAETFLGPGSFWDSDSAGGTNPFYKGDNTNETISIDIPVPSGAANAKIKFGYYNAANDWFWAIDNLNLSDPVNNSVWSENFEGVTLGPSVNERESLTQSKVTRVQTAPNTVPYENAFTHTPPGGWNIDNSMGLPGIGDPAQGVEEWEGWSFATPAFWTFADRQGRQNFTNGTGVIAIADPDEWDDLGNPEGIGTYNSKLETPLINIAGAAPGSMYLKFNSSWDPEDTQTAVIEVDYGNGYAELLRWESASASPNFHGTNYDELVQLSLNNPAGATTARFRFSMLNATDDWWWALDNIEVGAVPEPGSAILVSLAMCGWSMVGSRRRG